MGKVKSQEKWQQILADQKASGLTIVDYCRQHQLSTSNFYTRRKLLAASEFTFIEAKITQQTELVVTSEPITITMDKATVSLPGTTTAAYLGQLLRDFT